MASLLVKSEVGCHGCLGAGRHDQGRGRCPDHRDRRRSRGPPPGSPIGCDAADHSRLCRRCPGVALGLLQNRQVQGGVGGSGSGATDALGRTGPSSRSATGPDGAGLVSPAVPRPPHPKVTTSTSGSVSLQSNKGVAVEESAQERAETHSGTGFVPRIRISERSQVRARLMPIRQHGQAG